MQNFDFYSGKMVRDNQPQYNREDPEYFARMAKIHSRDEHKSMKRASRIISLIIALCIISFTVGLILGIKFANGSKKEIVDQHTREAVSDFGKKVSNFISEVPAKNLYASAVKNKLLSKEDFPFVIQIGNTYNKNKSQELANIISNNGHTVILSKDDDKYRIFVGPFGNEKEADNSLKKIKKISNGKLFSNAVVLKR